MWEHELGPLRLCVEHRDLGGDGGATLRVLERDGGHERLRFDCFRSGPHYHLDAGGRDEVHRLDAQADNIGWVIDELRRDLTGMLEKADFRGALALSASVVDRALDHADAAMRNPPLDLDDLDPEVLRARVSEKWDTYDPDVLPAWVAEMDYPLAQPIRQVLEQALDRNDLGYPVALRDTGLREAFCERMKARFDWSLEPSRIEILTDVVQGLYGGLAAYSEPGDGAIVQTPIYRPFLSAVDELGRRLVENRLVPHEGRFAIDFDALRSAIDERTRVLMLCNPHNPTGCVFSRRELETLAEIACDADLVVLADEIHADLVYPGHEHVPFGRLGDEVAKRTVTINSATKAFNIPGLRCAVAHFGSEELQQRFVRAAPSHIRGGIGLLGIYATIAAWRHSQPWLDRVVLHLARNRALLGELVSEKLPGAIYYAPDATYLAWIDLRALALEPTAGRYFLRHGRVAVSDGPVFGSDLEGFVRINFATSKTLLTQAVERMASTLPA